MNNPRKSKAWIIVLIVVIILTAVVYFLFNNKEQIFGTKNAENITKTFSPLLGSSKKKDTVTPSGTTSDTTTTDGNATTTDGTMNGDTVNGGFGAGDGFTTGDGFDTGDGFGTNTNASGSTSYSPPLNPLPTPGAGGTIEPGPTPNPGIEPTPLPPTPAPTPNPNTCPDDPLVFTDTEKEELAVLLRQYYLIAPTIKNADDLVLVNNEILTNQALLTQVDTLTNQCRAEKININYTGPQTIKDNPYYDDPANTNGVPYLPTLSQLEDIFDIW